MDKSSEGNNTGPYFRRSLCYPIISCKLYTPQKLKASTVPKIKFPGNYFYINIVLLRTAILLEISFHFPSPPPFGFLENTFFLRNGLIFDQNRL